jgi:hypothetical protein
MFLPVFLDDGLKVDVVSIALSSKTSIKRCGRLPTGLTNLISLQGPLDDIRDRAVLPASQSVSEITRSGTPDGKLGFCHLDLLSRPSISDESSAIKMADAGMMAKPEAGTL